MILKKLDLNLFLLVYRALFAQALSIFKPMGAANDPYLKMRFLTIVLAMTFVFPLFAQTQPIQREELFIRAYKSLGFFIHMAQDDQSFLKNLTPSELQMMNGIYDIAMETATLNWLVENKVQRFGKFPRYVYAYTITKNRIVRLTTDLEKPIALNFSQDQSLFNLDHNQPIRTAVTEAGLDKDIYVNLKMINEPGTQWDLPLAVSLLIHEFGHKLDKEKNQPAVDSLAAKMESYLRSLISVTEANGKKIYLLRFKIMPNYDLWLERILYGEYKGVNIPKQIYPLISFDKQGIYVWIDDNGRVTDISDSITKEIRKNAIVQFEDQPAYQFLRHNLVMASSLTVSLVGSEHFKISINANLLQMVIPFMKAESYDPKSYKLYEKSFTMMDPYYGDFFNYEYTVDKNKYHFKKVRALPQTFEWPQYEVSFVRKKQQGSDLELVFSIKGDLQINLDDRMSVSELWPELKVRMGESEIYIKASDRVASSNEFKFVIKDFDKINAIQVIASGMQLRIKNQLIVMPATSQIGKLFLPNEIILSNGTADANFKSNPVKTAPVMKSVQLWDGSSWTSLRNKSQLKEGQLLRFVFNSTEPLRELSIYQKFFILNETSTSFMGQLIPGVGRRLEPQLQSIRIDSENMRQTVREGYLYVDVNIDHKLVQELKLSFELGIDHSGLPMGGTVVDSGFVENNTVSIQKERSVVGVSFVTRSGLSSDFNFKKPLEFLKIPRDGLPVADSMIYQKLKCNQLFSR